MEVRMSNVGYKIVGVDLAGPDSEMTYYVIPDFVWGRAVFRSHVISGEVRGKSFRISCPEPVTSMRANERGNLILNCAVKSYRVCLRAGRSARLRVIH